MGRLKSRKVPSKLWFRNGKRLIRLENLNTHNGENNLVNSTKITSKFDCRMKSGYRRISLLDLPDECILMVLEKLSFESHELCQIMRVCKRFYNLSYSRRLWRFADFQFSQLSYLYNYKHHPLYVDYPSRNLSNLQRRQMYANFLMKKEAIFSHLIIQCDIFREIGMLRCLIDKCCSRELGYLDIKWTYFYSVLLNERRKTNLQYFREIVEKLSVCCPEIYFLKSQVDGSSATARVLGTLTNIQCLQLIVEDWLEPEDQPNSKGFIEIILSSMSKLRKLKIKVRQNEDFSGYTLKSYSLEQLEYSWSKGFIIKHIDLPRLHTFLAFNVFTYNQGKTCCCLFELIGEGCPKLSRLNHRRSKIPGLKNFSLSDVDKKDLHIDGCNAHVW